MSTQKAEADETHGVAVARRLLAAAEETANRFALVVLTLLPRHPRIAPHRHAGQAEGYYVLEGTLAVSRGEQTIMLASGAAVCLPAGVTHGIWNPTAATTTALLIYTPGVAAEVADALAAGMPDDAPPFINTS